jgi:hypothetical protein
MPWKTHRETRRSRLHPSPSDHHAKLTQSLQQSASQHSDGFESRQFNGLDPLGSERKMSNENRKKLVLNRALGSGVGLRRCSICTSQYVWSMHMFRSGLVPHIFVRVLVEANMLLVRLANIFEERLYPLLCTWHSFYITLRNITWIKGREYSSQSNGLRRRFPHSKVRPFPLRVPSFYHNTQVVEHRMSNFLVSVGRDIHPHDHQLDQSNTFQ